MQIESKPILLAFLVFLMLLVLLVVVMEGGCMYRQISEGQILLDDRSDCSETPDERNA